MFAQSVRDFLYKEIVPHHAQWEKDKMVSRESWQLFGEAGYLCPQVDEQYGGLGLKDFRYNAIIIEEIAKLGLASEAVGYPLHSDILCPYIVHYGTEFIKNKWLPKMVAGEAIAAIAMTEPGAGSDLQGMRATAIKNGDHYIINGSKTFITNGYLSDVCVVAAKTDPTKGARGISLFLIESGMKGYTKGKPFEKVGLHAQDTCELFFENVVVPVENLLGVEGEGFKYLMTELSQERLVVGLGAIGASEGLLAVTIQFRAYSEKELKRKGDPLEFLKKNVGPGTPARMNQGNKELASHAIWREQCLAGLQGVVLQTDEQRQRCGADYMVPVYRKGDPSKAKFCIDIFEFPNRPCELPFVWAGPTQARIYCEMQGKRLCAQEEWVQACRGDPEGKEDQLYAYGNELDLTACNTNKPASTYGELICDPDSVTSTWKTCHSNTEPAGSFPRCRSRFGVFDLHGNVAEAMVRFDPEENGLVSQLKGSAWFYTEVALEPGAPPKPGSFVETYPDTCNFDPRWWIANRSRRCGQQAGCTAIRCSG